MSETVKKTDEQYQLIHGLNGLSKFLGVSLRTACILKKELPHYQRGRTILFKPDEVLAAMSKNPKSVEK